MKSILLYSLVGSAIKQAREARGLTQEELASTTGLGRMSITNIEAGEQKVQLETVYAIALSLDYPIEHFLPSLTKDLFDPLDEAFRKFLQSYQRGDGE